MKVSSPAYSCCDNKVQSSQSSVHSPLQSMPCFHTHFLFVETAGAVSTSSSDPALAAHSPARESASPLEPVTAHDHTLSPLSISDESWARLGAKPKDLASSTPSQPWSRAGPNSRRGKSSPHARPDFIPPLQNTFDILGMTDFPPMAAPPSSRLSYGSRRSPPAQRRRTMPNFTPAPRRPVSLLSHPLLRGSHHHQLRPLINALLLRFAPPVTAAL